ncbi:MAG: glycosyltransferase family 4 protein [Bryobacteraceae bacterium]
MKVLHIDTGREMRGGQHQVLLLLKLLDEAGIDVKLLAREGSPLLDEARKLKFKVAPATVRNVFIDSCDADLTHAHDARAHTIAAIACCRPIVVSRRVAFPVKSNVLSHWKYTKAARFLAVSQFVRNQLQAAGIPPAKIDVVHDAFAGREPGIWDPIAPAVALESNDPRKGRPLIEQASKLCGIPVHFSANLPRDLSRASMFVYITQTEGLGSAAILAMQMGIPVIASCVGGLAEVFEHQRSGLYTENQPEEIAKNMSRLAQDGKLVAAMIAEAKTRAHEKFSPERLVDDTTASYGRALSG